MSFTWHLARVRSFFLNYARLLLPAFSANRLAVARATLLNFAGASSRGAMIGYIGYFANALQSSVPTVVPLLHIELQRNTFTVVALGVGVLILNVFGAWSSYDAAVVARRIGRYTHLFYMSRALDMFRNTKSLELSAGQLYEPSDVMTQVMRNAIQIAISAEGVVRCIHPLAYSAVALWIALKVDPMMTLLITPVALAALPVIYLTSARITSSSRSFYQQQVKDYGREVTALISDINHSTVLFPQSLSPERLTQMTHVKGYLQGFDRNQLANENMTLVMALVRTLVLAGAITLFGVYALNQERSWGQLLVYILALYYLIESVQQLAHLLVNLNRFYPQISSYLEFTSRAQAWAATIKGLRNHAKSLTLRVTQNPLPGSEEFIEIEKPGRYYFHSAIKPTRLNFGYFAKPLEDAGANRAFWATADLVSSAHRCIGTTLAYAILGPDAGEDPRRWLKEILQEIGLGQEVDALPNNIDTFVDEGRWEQFSPRLKAALRLLPIFQSASDVVFVDETAIAGLKTEALDRLWNDLAHKFVFIVTDGRAQFQPPEDQLVLVSAGGRLVGIGPGRWYREARKTIGTLTSTERQLTTTSEEFISTI